MKKTLFLFTLLFLLGGCAKEPFEDTELIQTVEGRWLYESNSIMSAGGVSILMFEFIDGVRYTYYYEGTGTPTLSYYEGLTTADAETVTEPYAFENETLVIFHDGFEQVLPLVIECDGGRINFTRNQDPSWVRLESPQCNN